MQYVQTYELAYFWYQIRSTDWLGGPILLHFALIFSGHNNIFKHKYQYILLYAPGILFLIFHLLTDWLFVAIEKPMTGGWTAIKNEKSLVSLVANTWIILLLISAILLISYTFYKTEDDLKKKQARLIMAAFFLFAFTGIICEIVEPVIYHIRLTELTIFKRFLKL